MTKLEQLEVKLRRVTEEEQEKNILRIVANNEHYLVDLNTFQLMHGKDTDGVFIEPPYRSVSYAHYKLFLNPLGVVDLFLTGDFQKSIFIKADSFPITFDAGDSKKSELVNKYGKILGLNEENKKIMVEHIKSQVQEYYRTILQV